MGTIVRKWRAWVVIRFGVQLVADTIACVQGWNTTASTINTSISLLCQS